MVPMTRKTIVACALAVAAGLALAGSQVDRSERLGKSIFHDNNLSIRQNQSCATCHGLDVGGTGPDATINQRGTVYEGSIAGRFGDRKPPASCYATSAPNLRILKEDGKAEFVGGNFWDGRATGERLGNPAADQAQGPFLNPLEQALPDAACVVWRVCKPVKPADYPVTMQDAWGKDACVIAWPGDVEKACTTEGRKVALSASDRARADRAYDLIARSIAAYEASPEASPFASKYDLVLAKKAQWTDQETSGLSLFRTKGRCVNCHPEGGAKPLFTDFRYDNLGIPANPANPALARDPKFVDRGLGGFLETRPAWKDYAAANLGKHRAPTLRNVDRRPAPGFVKAYAHNGYFKSLEEIVHFYNTRDVLPKCKAGDPGERTTCWPAPEVAANVNTQDLGNLGLTAEEEKAIVAFLKTLTDR